MSRSADSPDILVLPPVLVGGALLIGILLHYTVWPVAPLPVFPARVLGLSVFVLAGLLATSLTTP